MRLATVVALAAATIAAFAGVARNGWVLFDDPLYVLENPHVNRGVTLAGLRWFLTEPHGGNWHPLTSLSHMLDVACFRLQPAGPHLVNLALHALNAVLLLLVLARLTGAWWRSAIVAALFALHPLRVESVAWISERKDVLSGALFLLTIGAYARWVAKPRPREWIVVLAALALGLMSKPMLVTLPFVLVLLDVWPLGRWRSGPPAAVRTAETDAARAPARSLGGLLAEKWPLFVLVAVLSVVTFLVQRKSGAVVSTEHSPLALRALNALISYGRYAAKSVWPSGLAPFYPNYVRPSAGLAGLAALAIVAVSAIAIADRRRRPYLAIGWFWYLGMLLPVIGIVQVGAQSWADRYSYLPVIGLAIVIVWTVADAVTGRRALRVAWTALTLVALAALGLATARQVARWRDTRTLFSYTLAVTGPNHIADVCLGDVLMKEGRPADAVSYYAAAARLAPDFVDVHDKLGSAYGALGKADSAIAELRIAERQPSVARPRIEPERRQAADIHHNLGFALARVGRTDDAIAEFRAALALEPDHWLSLMHLGAALGASGRGDEAAVPLRHAVELAPDSIEAWRLLAMGSKRAGRAGEMVSEYEEVLRRSPDDLDALVNVAWIRATYPDERLRDGAEALRLAERAQERSPEKLAILYAALAAAHAETGHFADAVAAAEFAVTLAQKNDAKEEVRSYAEQAAVYRGGRPFRTAP